MFFSQKLFMELREELSLLEKKERIAIYCKFWKSMDTFEIARILHVSQLRTDRLLSQALMKLRKNLLESQKQNKKVA